MPTTTVAVTVPSGRPHAAERIVEIGQILAAGLIRLRARKSSPIVANSGERSLDCVGPQSGHANPETENA
jgi:hypothetical protein